jgi:hypothetical protein
MENIVLKIKDPSKVESFLQILQQFDFIEVETPSNTKNNSDNYDLFASAGRWKDKR